jgi:DNA-binding FadR family transcriptional regulator
MLSRSEATVAALRDRLYAGLHLGTLHAGDRVGSVRDTAAALRVPPRAVQAAFRRLAEEGLVEVRARSGVFLNEPRGAPATLPPPLAALVDLLVDGASAHARFDAVMRQARLCLRETAVRVACVECNADQLYALTSHIREDYGFDAIPVDLDSGDRRSAGRRAEKADVVVTTRFHLAPARALAGRLRRPLVQATLAPAFYETVRRLLAAGRLWWVCTDRRFASKLPRMWPGSAIRPVVLGEDPLEAVPADAAVYATRLAAQRLPPRWHGGRVVTVHRAFSRETARALLAFRLQLGLAGRR